MNEIGLVTRQSSWSVEETANRLASLVTEKGLTVFARVDHAANAHQVGLDLRPLQLILFGNPRAGTLLMQESPTSGIDLPFRAVVWEDEAGDVWLSYNDAQWIATRHGISRNAEVVAAIATGMKAVCERVVGRGSAESAEEERK